MSIQYYEAKFKSFLEKCAKTKAEGADAVVIHHPEVLGDNYSELVESLNRLSAAGLKLVIIPPDQRGVTQ